MTAEPIDVVLAEDHPTFRLGLRTRLSMEPDIQVVGEAGTGREALSLAEQLAPDVVVDLNLPELDGVALIRRLGAVAPRVAPLVLTMVDDDSVFPAVRAGARGYLLKDAEPGRIVAAIRAVAAGETVFSGAIAERLLHEHRTTTGVPGHGPFQDLSPREREILELIAHGLSNAAIGHRLGLRPKTVRNYVSNVITKMQVADRTEAMLRGHDAGLGA